MQCQGALRGPLRNIIKSIGTADAAAHSPQRLFHGPRRPRARQCARQQQDASSHRSTSCRLAHSMVEQAAPPRPEASGCTNTPEVVQHKNVPPNARSPERLQSRSSGPKKVSGRNKCQYVGQQEYEIAQLRNHIGNLRKPGPSPIPEKNLHKVMTVSEESGSGGQMATRNADKLMFGYGTAFEDLEFRAARDDKSNVRAAQIHAIQRDVTREASIATNICESGRSRRESQLFRKMYSVTRHKAEKRRRRRTYQTVLHDYPGVLNWRDVLRTLDDHTPDGEELYRKRSEVVKLPAGLTAAFNGSPGAAILEIMQRTNCHVQLAKQTSGSFSHAVLFGASYENTAAMKILPEYVHVRSAEDLNTSRDLGDYTLEREFVKASTIDARAASQRVQHLLPSDENMQRTRKLEEMSSASKNARIRSVWIPDRHNPSPPRELLFQTSNIATAPALTAYFSDLVRPTPRLEGRKAFLSANPHVSTSSHVDIVTETLLSVLAEPHVGKIVTTEAVDLTLQFFVRHAKFPEIRKAYSILLAHGYAFTHSNYDVLIAGAANAEDLHNFRYLLMEMRRRGMVPTPRSWVNFHTLISRRFPEHTSTVTESMRRKGLLANNHAALRVATNSVARDLTMHLGGGGTVKEFVELYDQRFVSWNGRSSFNWLGPDAMNTMAHTLFRNRRHEDAFEVLAEFRRRTPHAGVNDGTLGIFLTPALREHDPKIAINALRHFCVGLPGAIMPGAISYTILFKVAWKKRYFNMLRVIWRYACVADRAGRRWQMKLLKSLNSSLYKHSTASHAALWYCWVGKFAVGVADGLRCSGTYLNGASRLQLRRKDDSKTGVPPTSAPLTELDSRHDAQFPEEDSCQVATLETDKQSAEYHEPPEDLMGDKGSAGSANSCSKGISASSHADLSPHESKMVQMATASSALYEHHELKRLIEVDQCEAKNSKPVKPFGILLEEAWQKDLKWERDGLGLPSRLTEGWSLEQMFETMMRDGIQVPMAPGDYTAHHRTYEIPWKLEAFRRANGLDETGG